MGVLFSLDEQKQLTTTGHGGRVFELEMTPGGEKVPALVSMNKITNRVEAVPLSEIQIPQKLKGVELSQEQQDGLKNGQGVLVENMDKKLRPGEEPGGKITRIVQYNAVIKTSTSCLLPNNASNTSRNGWQSKNRKRDMTTTNRSKPARSAMCGCAPYRAVLN